MNNVIFKQLIGVTPALIFGLFFWIYVLFGIEKLMLGNFLCVHVASYIIYLKFCQEYMTIFITWVIKNPYFKRVFKFIYIVISW